MIQIKEGMQWPPVDADRRKMEEHSAWFSGEPVLLANFYYDKDLKDVLANINYSMKGNNKFWGRQIKNDSQFSIHVPLANDIAETSASFLFGESPLIRFKSSDTDTMKVAQSQLDEMLTKSGLYSKILEAAEVCSAMGGVYLKLAWDSDISDEPIPVVVQPDDAFPTFKFGQLSRVDFVYEVANDKSVVHRLVETVERGMITNTLFRGTADRLGNIVELSDCPATEGLPDVIPTPDIMTCVYIPNMLPNKLNRRSPMGRSDYQGQETLMDALDETFSAWMIDVQLSRGRIMVPSSFFADNGDGGGKFNIDTMVYEEFDVDPTSMSQQIVANQFGIRSEEFEKTALNLIDRIITSAGYSPQSFGLNIAGRAESGTALNVRERKSFSTTNKKQAYWEQALKHFVKAMCMIRGELLGKRFTCELDVNIAFADGISNNLSETATSLKMLSDAKAVSTDTKVRMVHPEWTDEQVEDEVERILNEDSVDGLMSPEDGVQQAFGLGNSDNQDDDEGFTD